MNTGGACPDGLQQVFFADPREGWVLAQEPTFDTAELFHTTDSGARWTLVSQIDVLKQFNRYVSLGHGLTGRLIFQTSSLGWFVPDFSEISANPLFVYRTTDGGVTWAEQMIPTPQETTSNITSVRFFDNRQGVLEIGSRNHIYVSITSDGGQTWSSPNLVPTRPPQIMSYDQAWLGFIDSRNWLTVGFDGLLRTTDAGKSWHPVATTMPLCAPNFVDPLHGWVRSGAALFGTTDGGRTWVQLDWPAL